MGFNVRKRSKCNCKECDCMKSEEDLIIAMEDQRLPFTEEIISERIKIRHFNPNYPDHLFKWHYDEEDRVIEALNPNDWQFQFDNELPINLSIGHKVFIETGIYHRLIKGTTMLSVRILS